ncbi:methyl-accepting chemotaxis protein [Thalassolituus sp. LLYu03]|uniref:methyl-accepting chemotaxis protein n=1 Tax=Thalassolituus sp. LLYu03 TaxID=3421656 RepID=UPI003D2D8D18
MSIKQLIAALAVVVGVAMAIVGSIIWQEVQQLRGVLERNEKLLLPILAQGYEAKINTIQVQQWLTDISATRGEDGLDDGFTEAKAAYEGFQANLKQLMVLDPEHQDLYTGIKPVFDVYYAAGKEMATAYVEEGTSAGNAHMEAFDFAASAITDKMTEVQAHLLKLAKHDQHIASTILKEQNEIILLSFLTLIGVLMGLFYIIHRKVAIPARIIADKLTAIAAGDLRGELQYKSADELGRIASASRRISRTYQDFIAKIIGSANMNSSYSYALLFSVQDAVKFVEEQTEESVNVIREVEELCHSTDHMQEALKKARDETSGARGKVNDSRTTLEDARSTVEEMGSQLEQAEQAIISLANQTQTINTVITTISAVAEQTNLLALNAAIEAARAGDQGRGFAVVADEVRALAQRTQESTSEIRSTIDTLQKLSENAVGVINRSRKVAERNASISGDVIASLQAIFEYIESIHSLNQSVNTLSDEQLRDINKIRERSTTIDELSGNVRSRIMRADRFSHQMRDSIKAFTKVSNEVKID